MTSKMQSNYRVGTLTSPISGADTSGLTIEQYGRVVTINGFIRDISFTADTEKQILKISGVDLPKIPIRAVVGVASNPYNVPTASYGVISTSGDISVRTSLSGSRSVILSITYIA